MAVKHVLLAKFKEEVSPEAVDDLIKGYANLVSLIPPMKAFHWGRDVSIENLHQGFTHVFESTFDGVEGIAEYIAHPAHVEFANKFLPALEKVIVIDYAPTAVN
ncbi:stress-response A/B barrel domain-containing protein HS1 [Musa acuminata AAA Group]|uniref:stress-response A/B barrel domain-containing protein HS1 n=1 Tax=Musa acuminata AAA Group TaxID=214697 RepID=UPI0031E355AC